MTQVRDRVNIFPTLRESWQVIAEERNPPAGRAWGWLPALALVVALGDLLVVAGYTVARNGGAFADLLFWLGIMAMFVPVALRLAAEAITRHERLGCVIVLTLGLYLAKVLRYPLWFAGFDEFLHWRSAEDIVRSHHLFAKNPMLPASPLFPGLESVTNALQSLTSLPTFPAGVIVIGIAKIVLVLALFLLYEELTQSARAAGIATLLYTACPNFSFFDAQYAYESLALPFAVLTVYAIIRRERVGADQRVGITLLALLSSALVIVTHHVTSYVLALFLALWALVHAVMTRSRYWSVASPNPTGMAFFHLFGSLAWMVYIGSFVITYLSVPLAAGFSEFFRLVTGSGESRQLFHAGGYVTPPWEQYVGYASVLLTLIVLPFGLLVLGRRDRSSPLAVAFALAALAYPATLGLRFTTVGAEVSSRTLAFLFIAIAPVLAVGVAAVWRTQRAPWPQIVLFALWSGTIFMGGVITGRGPSVAALPGRYVVAADQRSIDPQGIAAAHWALVNLGPDNRIVADRSNSVLMLTFGAQYTLTQLADHVPSGVILLSPRIDTDVLQALEVGHVAYLVIDRRMSTGLPLYGVYVETGEPGSLDRTAPVDISVLEKFENYPGVRQVYDSGDIVIYDVREVSDAP